MQPEVVNYRVPVRSAAPQAIGLARALGWLFGKSIKGDNGAIRYGYPTLGTRAKFTGYAYPPQLFVGYDPAKVAAGLIRADPASMPGESVTPYPANNSPMMRAMSAVTTSQMAQ